MRVRYALAIVGSMLMIMQAFGSLNFCINPGGCGTPCVSSNFDMLVSSAVLVFPFMSLLWAKGLSTWGLVARCAVTSGIAVVGVTIAVLVWMGRFWI